MILQEVLMRGSKMKKKIKFVSKELKKCTRATRKEKIILSNAKKDLDNFFRGLSHVKSI